MACKRELKLLLYLAVSTQQTQQSLGTEHSFKGTVIMASQRHSTGKKQGTARFLLSD